MSSQPVLPHLLQGSNNISPVGLWGLSPPPADQLVSASFWTMDLKELQLYRPASDAGYAEVNPKLVPVCDIPQLLLYKLLFNWNICARRRGDNSLLLYTENVLM